MHLEFMSHFINLYSVQNSFIVYVNKFKPYTNTSVLINDGNVENGEFGPICLLTRKVLSDVEIRFVFHKTLRTLKENGLKERKESTLTSFLFC